MTRRRRRLGTQADGVPPGRHDTSTGKGSRPQRRPDPVVPQVPIPSTAAPVAWTAGLRVELPDYVGEQIREACYRMRCTQVALVLRLLSQFRDGHGRAVFEIRQEDLVADRRKRR